MKDLLRKQHCIIATKSIYYYEKEVLTLPPFYGHPPPPSFLDSPNFYKNILTLSPLLRFFKNPNLPL